MWARGWLQKHGVGARLAPGWTYLFEAVYRSSCHVVPYPFEGLVLLSAVGPDGMELPSPDERQALARQLGTMAAPCLEGPLAELHSRLARGAVPAAAAVSPAGRGSGSRGGGAELAVPRAGSAGKTELAAPPSFEGWVLEASSGQRLKLVQAAFKRAGAAAVELLHPLVLWDAVRCGGASRAGLAVGLPPHMQRELHAELDAMEGQFCQLSCQLAAAWTWAQQGQEQHSQGGRSGAGGQPGQLEELLAGLSLDAQAPPLTSAALRCPAVSQLAAAHLPERPADPGRQPGSYACILTQLPACPFAQPMQALHPALALNGCLPPPRLPASRCQHPTG